jgi:hypothetical protein
MSAKSKTSEGWFFSDPAAVAKLYREAFDWTHDRAGRRAPTPFRFGSSVKGATGGTDCVGLVEQLMAASGIERFNFPREPIDNSRHAHNDKILNYLRGQHADPQSKILAARFAELPLPEKKKRSAFLLYYDPPFMPGDLLIMKTGKGLWHMPVMMNDHVFIQCAFPDGVSEGDILAPNYHGYLVALFRARNLK